MRNEKSRPRHGKAAHLIRRRSQPTVRAARAPTACGCARSGCDVAWQLVAEVFEHAPADLDPAERSVLLALAEWIYAPGRMTTRPIAELGRRVGQHPRTLRRTLRRLALRGLEVRVPLRDDKNGRPLFAVPGTVTRFRLPPFAPDKGDTGVPLSDQGKRRNRRSARGTHLSPLPVVLKEELQPEENPPASLPPRGRPHAHASAPRRSHTHTHTRARHALPRVRLTAA